MEAVVHVTLKKTVLDPQGRTICSALNNLGHDSVTGVRAGKFFEIELAQEVDPARAREQIERIAREVLANPVIEEYTVDIRE